VSFTLNVGVIIGKLVDPRYYGQYLKNPSKVNLQIWTRIGQLLSRGVGAWWTISDASTIDSLEFPEWSKDFTQAVLEKAVPFVEYYMNIQNVIHGLEKGTAPGLTEGQRVRYMARLRELVDAKADQ
jgi:hypothetical protein